VYVVQFENIGALAISERCAPMAIVKRGATHRVAKHLISAVTVKGFWSLHIKSFSVVYLFVSAIPMYR
jgi:hypothetical protein